MSAAGRTQVVDVTYDDPRTGDRIRERKVQQVPWEEIEQIRGQELALFRPPNARARADERDERDYYGGGRAYEDYQIARPRPRERLAPPHEYRYDDRYAIDRERDRRREDDRRRRRRRRDDYSDSDSESSRERRHRRRHHRRAKSEQAPNRDQQGGEEDDYENEPMFYSGKPRKEGNWRERNFDSSYDGLLAAAAGAALGGITARHWVGQENRGWKIAGSAVAGATAMNLAENKYRLWTEEREERKEREGRGRDGENGQMSGPLECVAQMVDGGVVPGL